MNKDDIMNHLEKKLLEESDLINEPVIEEFEELPFDTGDPRMTMTPKEVFERYDICPDCADTGVIGAARQARAQDFCNCVEGDILKALAFGQPVEIKFTLVDCPQCDGKRGRGRKYDGNRRVIYCPDWCVYIDE